MSALSKPSPQKTRRPFVWQPPDVPRLADLFAGQARRRRFFAYWRGDGLLDLGDEILFFFFRWLPPQFASWLGGRSARFFGPRNYPELHRQLRRSLAILRPELDEAGRGRMAISFFDNFGRVSAEYPLLNSLHAAGRVRHENGEALQKLQAQGPVILLGLHLANWEVLNFVCFELGIVFAAIYKPPARAAQLRIAVTSRKRPGLTLLPPGIAGARPALRVLLAGGVLCIFGDEEHEGRAMAPFFGNKPHLNGNLTIAARLARMTGARVMVFHGERRPDGDYVIKFENPTPLPSQADPHAPLLDDVIALNAAIEPIIRAHCDSWYFLSHLHLP